MDQDKLPSPDMDMDAVTTQKDFIKKSKLIEVEQGIEPSQSQGEEETPGRSDDKTAAGKNSPAMQAQSMTVKSNKKDEEGGSANKQQYFSRNDFDFNDCHSFFDESDIEE